MIRPYKPGDNPSLIALLRHHIPQYFAPSEEADFVEYLDKYREDYFVYEENGSIIGAGGVNYFLESGEARISWDFIHPDYQGKGIGSELLQHRIALLKAHPAVSRIMVRTSQHAYLFYQKNGFVLEKTEKDFWAIGFDLYQMNIDLGND